MEGPYALQPPIIGKVLTTPIIIEGPYALQPPIIWKVLTIPNYYGRPLCLTTSNHIEGPYNQS